MESSLPEIIITINRIRILKDVYSIKSAPLHLPKVVGRINGYYGPETNLRIIQSDEKTIYEGVKFSLPYHNSMKNQFSLQKLILQVYQIDGPISVDIGTCTLLLSESERNVLVNMHQTLSDIVVDIASASNQKLGKVMISIHAQNVYKDEKDIRNKKSEKEEGESSLLQIPIPNFRFQRLSRCINWERIRSLPMDKIILQSDTRCVLSCLKDISTGDTSQEQIDPDLRKALRTLQYGTQYLVSCRELFNEKLVRGIVAFMYSGIAV